MVEVTATPSKGTDETLEEKDVTAVTPSSRGKTQKSSSYGSVAFAYFLTRLIIPLGILGLILLGLVQFGNLFKDGNNPFSASSSETVEEVVVPVTQDELNSTVPSIQIGTGMDDAETSAKNIIGAFVYNNTIPGSYWGFRVKIADNADELAGQIGSEVIIDSPNQLGSDTEAIFSDRNTTCVVQLVGELTYECSPGAE